MLPVFACVNLLLPLAPGDARAAPAPIPTEAALDRAFSAYRQARTLKYAASLIVAGSPFGSGRYAIRAFFQKPNKYRVELYEGGALSQLALCDGKIVTEYDPEAGVYTQYPMSSEAAPYPQRLATLLETVFVGNEYRPFSFLEGETPFALEDYPAQADPPRQATVDGKPQTELAWRASGPKYARSLEVSLNASGMLNHVRERSQEWIESPGGMKTVVADEDFDQTLAGVTLGKTPLPAATFIWRPAPQIFPRTSASADETLCLVSGPALRGEELTRCHVNPDGTLTLVRHPLQPSLGFSNLSTAVLSTNGKFLFATLQSASGPGTVAQLARTADGSFSPLAPSSVLAGKGPEGIALSQDGRFAYVADDDDDRLSTYRIGSDGGLTAVAETALPQYARPYALVLSPSGRFLFVSGQKTLSFRVGADGALTGNGDPLPGGGHQIAISADGRTVYLAANDGITPVDVSPEGFLRFRLSGTVSAGGTVSALLLSPDGHCLYAAVPKRHAVAQFQVNPDGTLGRPATPDVYIGGMPVALAASPETDTLYAADEAGLVFPLHIGTGGALSSRSPAPVRTFARPVALIVLRR